MARRRSPRPGWSALHLAHAREGIRIDKFVLAEIEHSPEAVPGHPPGAPGRAAAGPSLMGRVEIVGGNYNEPNTNLTGAESTIRNAVYGLGYQRDAAGGYPRTAWMLDQCSGIYQAIRGRRPWRWG